jgi:hypothetical protein
VLAKWSRDVAQPELHEDLLETARRILKTNAPKKRVTVEKVAKLWHAARENGATAPREEVVRMLADQDIKLSERTISRYIFRAKEQGLIPRNWR